jgi:hypothetical protein
MFLEPSFSQPDISSLEKSRAAPRATRSGFVSRVSFLSGALDDDPLGVSGGSTSTTVA